MKNIINKAGWIVIILLSVLAFLAALVGFSSGINYYDEGISLVGAENVLSGQVPYQDFWAIYAPAQFFVLAGLFKVFGLSLWTARIYGLAAFVGIALTVFFVVRNLTNARAATVASVFVGSWLWCFGYYAAVMTWAVLFALLSTYCCQRFFQSEKPALIYVAGLLAAMAGLYRHDVGVYVVLVHMLIFAIHVQSRHFHEAAVVRIKNWVAIVLRYLFAVLILVGPALTALLVAVPVDEFFRSLVEFPLSVFPHVRALPFPSLTSNNLVFYFPFFVLGSACIYLLSGSAGSGLVAQRTTRLIILMYWLLALAFFNQVRVRSDFPHLMPMLLVVIILLVVIAHKVMESNANGIKISNKVTKYAYVITFALGLFAFFKPVGKEVDLIRSYVAGEGQFVSSLERVQGMRFDNKDAAFESAVRYIQANVPVNEMIYVGNFRHDRVLVSDITFYFLSGRRPATKYYELHPGMTTTGEVQAEIIDSLKRHGVEYIVLRDFDNTEPNEGGRSSGIFALDEYIRRNYSKVMTFDFYQIWKISEVEQPQLMSDAGNA